MATWQISLTLVVARHIAAAEVDFEEELAATRIAAAPSAEAVHIGAEEDTAAAAELLVAVLAAPVPAMMKSQWQMRPQ